MIPCQVNSGAIMSASLLLYMVKPELTVSEKFEYVHHFFTRSDIVTQPRS